MMQNIFYEKDRGVGSSDIGRNHKKKSADALMISLIRKKRENKEFLV